MQPAGTHKSRDLAVWPQLCEDIRHPPPAAATMNTMMDGFDELFDRLKINKPTLAFIENPL